MVTSARIASTLGFALMTAAFGLPARAAAQEASPPPAAAAPADPEMTAFAKAWVEVGHIRDSYQAQVAMRSNKTLEHQADLRLKYKAEVDQAIQKAGLTPEVYRKVEFSIVFDEAKRAAFEEVLKAMDAA